MKKILFGSAAALCAAVGFSSFKTSSAVTNYYWFSISKNVAKSMSKPALKNTDITHTFILSTTTPALPALANFPSCAGSSYYCVAGFSTAQLTAAHNYLKTSISVPTQNPITAGYTRN
jgi:hypothetical protein